MKNPQQILIPSSFVIAEKVFAVIFIIELAMRLFVHGVRLYQVPDKYWNMFDTLCVGLQLLEFASEFIAGSSNTNFSFLRVLRTVRLLKIMRVVRLLRFIQELRSMVTSLASSTRSLVWSLTLMGLMTYAVGAFFGQIIVDQMHDNPELPEDVPELSLLFGNLPLIMLSMYQAVTGGRNWGDVLLPLWAVWPWLTLPFIVYVSFGILSLMNVMTGIFVESAIKTAKRDKDKQLASEVRRLFQQSETNDNGMISWPEFSRQLQDEATIKGFRYAGISCDDAETLFELLDSDGSGFIDPDEFLRGCLRLNGPARAADLLQESFNFRYDARMLAEKIDIIELRLTEVGEALEIDSSISRNSSQGRKSSRTRVGPRGSGVTMAMLETEYE
eukprot:TRINITY_DN19439_c0_g1_i2.p1 TRINITY_DN19439_c0_g1~~TRINITY_DN19439_c0_g1_i2.p1  ORF type:complete len:386 (+),score=71.84 TRINITY_DN19439_c0_g1_i2:878-2035(+)